MSLYTCTPIVSTVASVENRSTVAERRQKAIRLIEARRLGRSRRERISTTDAAGRAGISRDWWRKVILGAPTSDEVIMDMARAVGVAEEVAQILGVEYDEDETPYTDPAERELWDLAKRYGIPAAEGHAWVAMLRARRQQLRSTN